MNFLHYDLQLSHHDVVVVTLDKQANVQLMDDFNFAKYKRGEQFRYYGGLAKQSPVRINAPTPGHWHLTVDLGGYAGTVHASVNVERA